MLSYLTSTRGISTNRIVTNDGGEAACLWQELWIAPPGTAPTARPDAYSRDYVDIESVRKFDEYVRGGDYGEELEVDPTLWGDSLEAYAEALRKEPRSQAYVIVYPQYYVERWDEGEEGKMKKRKRVHLDSSRVARRLLKEIKSDLIRKHHIAADRIQVVNGGYRKLRYVELWIVPRGEHAPIATPNAFRK
jgi:hypothetical protein